MYKTNISESFFPKSLYIYIYRIVYIYILLIYYEYFEFIIFSLYICPTYIHILQMCTFISFIFYLLFSFFSSLIIFDKPICLSLWGTNAV